MRIELDLGIVLYSKDELEKRRCDDASESDIDLNQAKYWLIDRDCDVMPLNTLDDLVNELSNIKYLKQMYDLIYDEINANSYDTNRKIITKLGPYYIYDELGEKDSSIE